MGYARSPFQYFEGYLGVVVGLDEEVIQLTLEQYNSNFVTYEILPGNYTMKGISEALYTMGDHEGTLQIEYDDISMNTKFILTRFRGNFGTLGLDEKSFFNTSLKFAPYWDYKPTNAIHANSPGVYTSDKNLFLSTIGKIQLKTIVNDGSIVIGVRQPILYSFVLDKPSGYKVI